MITLMVVVINELLQHSFKFTRQIIVLKQYLVLHGTVPALDLALCVWNLDAKSVVSRQALVFMDEGVSMAKSFPGASLAALLLLGLVSTVRGEVQ